MHGRLGYSAGQGHAADGSGDCTLEGHSSLHLQDHTRPRLPSGVWHPSSPSPVVVGMHEDVAAAAAEG